MGRLTKEQRNDLALRYRPRGKRKDASAHPRDVVVFGPRVGEVRVLDAELVAGDDPKAAAVRTRRRALLARVTNGGRDWPS